MSDEPWLAARVRSTPSRRALSFAQTGQEWSFRELDAHARRLAGALFERGLRPGQRLALWLDNGPDFAALLHAADHCGAILVPLNRRLTPRELRFQLEDCDAAILVHAKDEWEEASALVVASARQVLAVETLSREEPLGIASAPREARDAMALVYTSGTTGKPKGVVLTRENFFASAAASAFHLGVAPDDAWLACLPFFHVGGLSILLRSVLYGTRVLVHQGFDAEAVSRAIDRDGVTSLSLVATTLARLLDARNDAPPPSHFRFALVGGGPVPASLITRAQRAGFPICPTYGLSEAASQVATRPPGDRGSGLRPLPGARVRILRSDGREAQVDEEGEIVVEGPMVTSGYWRRPDESAQALRKGALHTGDWGALDRDGALRVVDRRRDLIVSGGENVSPSEVEAVLLEHPAVVECGVAATGDASFGQRPTAWLVLKKGGAPSEAELRRFCCERLAGYKVPVHFECVPRLPRNATGKLQRDQLSLKTSERS